MRISQLCLAFVVFGPGIVLADGRTNTNNIADDVIYAEDAHGTFYCGCQSDSHYNDNGSGHLTEQGLEACGYIAPQRSQALSTELQWEHIVPASRMPARQMTCWTDHPPDTSGRENCQDTDPVAQQMIFDLYNIVPSIGQVNNHRDNNYYGEIDEEPSEYGTCQIQSSGGIFEPPQCKRGDIARVWFYMEQVYGVEIGQLQRAMFERWSDEDPVSPWESERARRIAEYSRVINPFVDGVEPDPAGSCTWEVE